MSLYTTNTGQVGWPYSTPENSRLQRVIRRLRRRTKEVTSLLALTMITAFVFLTGLSLSLLWSHVQTALFGAGV
jgi:hypothetical protein